MSFVSDNIHLSAPRPFQYGASSLQLHVVHKRETVGTNELVRLKHLMNEKFRVTNVWSLISTETHQSQRFQPKRLWSS